MTITETKFIELTWDEWKTTYRPILDSDGQPRQFDWIGEDLDVLQSVTGNYVWTWRSGDGDCVTNGAGSVNRFAYFITEIPWQDGEDVFVTW